MRENTIIEGIAAPLPIANLDTDQIMPKQFLRIITKEGLDKGVLYDLRFDAAGAPRPEFVLNQPAYRGASMLLAGPNFGCGSSREHAVWGLQQLGIEVVIAPSYGEIFFGNALNNRLLLIVLAQERIDALAAQAPSRLTIDLDAMLVRGAGGQAFPFTLGERHKRMITRGLDMVGATMQQLPDIEAFERRHFARHPWARV
ncbi:3-isopropylmalate dehydratase small subunit [Pseudoduganella namucuonensis]|uniref:3-isopropylmalate dehydratase small subunit n=1 Tax=Pseudoduganella namucuonensis TaxID=1035707 RepID=A0A1I7GHP0_9BURK|nr:3-isopropylmalate dehydratase small subunit [Pseudoduganella namucuonensis]SFU47949.1 3-isopropylmalate/(R)-2-methylmalate dehydratase small subunit [Pseudoduganella namucuonensis]